MTAAARMRRCRDRERRGVMPVTIEVHNVDDIEHMIALGFLAEQQRDDGEAIRAAAQRVWDLQFGRVTP